MSEIITVLKKELKCFGGSDKGTFLLYAVLAAAWSLMLLSGDGENRLWFVFFSVVIAANFSATVFISERVNGTLEILITSGLSRFALLYGKMAFVVMMTSVIGAVCAGLAHLWSILTIGLEFSHPIGVYDIAIFLAVTYLNAASAAYFSVRLANPRFLHFINLMMVGAAVGLYGAVSLYFDTHPAMLLLIFLLLGAAFTAMAKREFSGERITRPMVF